MSEPKKRGRPVDRENRRFNVALYRLIRGECQDIGGTVAELAILTGLTADAIRCRVHAATHEYPPEELDPHAEELNEEDLSYLGRRYGRSDDPAVKEFLQSIRTDVRRKPDSVRSSVDRLKPSVN